MYHYVLTLLRYGYNWTSVLKCTFISHQNCDLTEETLAKRHGYYARVRSVLGDQASEWVRTSRYMPTQGNHLYLKNEFG